jgi:hypothetical protein
VTHRSAARRDGEPAGWLLQWAGGARLDHRGRLRQRVHYVGRPLSAPRLDTAGRRYVGTWCLRPAAGYPCPAVARGRVAGPAIDRHLPLIAQAVLSDFIEDGHFARHPAHPHAHERRPRCSTSRGGAGHRDVPAARQACTWSAGFSGDTRPPPPTAVARRDGPPLSTYRMRPGGRGWYHAQLRDLTPQEIRMRPPPREPGKWPAAGGSRSRMKGSSWPGRPAPARRRRELRFLEGLRRESPRSEVETPERVPPAPGARVACL